MSADRTAIEHARRMVDDLSDEAEDQGWSREQFLGRVTQQLNGLDLTEDDQKPSIRHAISNR
jgi:hypothetical protein